MQSLAAITVSLVAVLSALSLNAGARWLAALDTLPFVVRQLPQFSAETVAHGLLTRESICGRPAVVNIWATWCGPCRAEAPELVRLKEAFGDAIHVVGISYDDVAPETPGAVADFVERYALNFPVFVADEELRKKLPETPALPTTYLVNSNCHIGEALVGQITYAHVAPRIEALLQRPVTGSGTDQYSPRPVGSPRSR